MKNILIFKLTIFSILGLSFVIAFPISSLLKIKSSTNKIFQSTEKNQKESEESNRTFHHPFPFVHSPPIYFYEDILESSSNIYPSLLVKERPPLPPPPYPAHMIERWQQFYGFTSSTASNNRYPQPYPSKYQNPVYTSRPTTNKPKPTFINRLTTRSPPVQSTTTTTIQPKITSKPFIVQNNHGKNNTKSNFMQIVVHATTKSPLTIKAKPVNVLEPHSKPISKIGMAKQKSPSVVFSRPITVVNPEKHVNTTHHQSNIIVAQRPGTNRPVTTVLNTRPSGGGSSNTGGSNRPSAPYIALRPMSSALFPFFPPILAPNGVYSGLASGMQLMQSFLRNAMLGAVAMFIPSTLFALGLYAATQLNRDDSELPPIPSLSAGRFKRNLCVGVSCKKFDYRSTAYRAYKREKKKKILKKHRTENF